MTGKLEKPKARQIPASKNKDKGKRWERKFAGMIQGIFPDARRGLQGQGEGKTGISDLVNTGDWWFECKTSIKGPSIHEAYTQAVSACGQKKPVVIAQVESGQGQRPHDRYAALKTSDFKVMTQSLGISPLEDWYEPKSSRSAHFYAWIGELVEQAGMQAVIRVIYDNRDITMMSLDFFLLILSGYEAKRRVASASEKSIDQTQSTGDDK